MPTDHEMLQLARLGNSAVETRDAEIKRLKTALSLALQFVPVDPGDDEDGKMDAVDIDRIHRLARGDDTALAEPSVFAPGDPDG